MALDLKRMAKAIFFTIYLDKVWAETMISQPIFYLCQQVPYSTLSGAAVLLRHTLDKIDSHLGVNSAPVLPPSGQFFRNVHHG